MLIDVRLFPVMADCFYCDLLHELRQTVGIDEGVERVEKPEMSTPFCLAGEEGQNVRNEKKNTTAIIQCGER